MKGDLFWQDPTESRSQAAGAPQTLLEGVQTHQSFCESHKL